MKKILFLLPILLFSLVGCEQGTAPGEIAITSRIETLAVGENATLSATITPSDASQEVLWSSSNTAVATISPSGVLSGLSAGEVTVTAKAKAKQSLSDTLTVSVVSLVSVTGVTLDQTVVNIYADQTTALVATVLPENATNKSLTWTSSNEAVATVENGTVSGLSAGMTTVRATTVDGNFKASCSVIVVEKVEVDGINVSHTQMDIRKDGYGFLTAAVTPSDATIKGIKFESANEAVASINAKGEITGLTIGSTTIKVSSVDKPEIFKTISINVKDATWTGYTQESTGTPYFSYQNIQESLGIDAIPSVGTPNILVVPVAFTDYPYTADMLSDLNKLYNGNGAADTGYWESVSSFYYKSSFGKLDMNFTISDVYQVNGKAKEAVKTTSDTITILRSAVSAYKANQTTTNCREFDSDGNGLIDAVWMVYACPNDSGSNTPFWAFVYWDQGATPNTTSPVPCNYSWASYEFSKNNSKTTVDSHTFVHETGHLLGLNDYYNYNSSSTSRPLGKIDMMDANIGDHNAWSKSLLGWTEPIVVTGDARIEIEPSVLDGDVIFLSSDYNGTAFGEMIVLELYTPEGLNELDSTKPYTSYHPLNYSIPGIKMYHVDGRIRKAGSYLTNYNITIGRGGGYSIPAANTDNSERNGTAPYFFEEIKLIQAGGDNTFATGGSGSNADMFQTGDHFNFEKYASFFRLETMNDGSTLDYDIYFESVTADLATIVFQKNS